MKAQTLALYLGCECKTFAFGDSGNLKTTFKGIELRGDGYEPYVALGDGRTLNAGEIKLLLRPLSSMTEEEMYEYTILRGYTKDRVHNLRKKYAGWEFDFNPTNSGDGCFLCVVPPHGDSHKPDCFLFLLSKGFDLFGLIEKGEAIDSTKL